MAYLYIPAEAVLRRNDIPWPVWRDTERPAKVHIVDVLVKPDAHVTIVVDFAYFHIIGSSGNGIISAIMTRILLRSSISPGVEVAYSMSWKCVRDRECSSSESHTQSNQNSSHETFPLVRRYWCRRPAVVKDDSNCEARPSTLFMAGELF